MTSPATTLLVARDDDGAIVGMLTLALFRLPTGVRAWIEDVVVDERARRLGAGRALVDVALELAVDAGRDDRRSHVAPGARGAARLYGQWASRSARRPSTA